MTDFDVIVIGGGFAGVTAAREAGRAGLRCLLLEGRDRLGGRTWYTEMHGHHVELGGTWIHWTQPHIWAEVTRYGLEVIEHPGLAAPGHAAWIAGGRRRTGGAEELATLLEKCMTRFCHDAAEVWPRPWEPLFAARMAEVDRLSVQDRIDTLDLSDDEREILEGMWASACLSPCEESALTSMLWWWALGQRSFPGLMDAIARFTIRGGTKSLIDAIVAEGAPEVRLSTPVRQVKQDAQQVAVTTGSGETITARAAVIAVPVNALENITFSPALSPGKQAVAHERKTARGLKVMALVRNVPDDFLGVAPKSHAITFLSSEYATPEGEVMMVGFGPDATRLALNDRAAVQDAIREYLPAAEVVAARGHDWTADPMSQGVHAIFRPGQLSRYFHELQQPEGRLVFAGADIANLWNTFMDGAIESGLRAGQAVARMLG